MPITSILILFPTDLVAFEDWVVIILVDGTRSDSSGLSVGVPTLAQWMRLKIAYIIHPNNSVTITRLPTVKFITEYIFLSSAFFQSLIKVSLLERAIYRVRGRF